MKIALGLAAIALLAAAPAHAQSMGGPLSGTRSFPVLPYTAPANLPAVEVSGSDATFLPSSFVTFEAAVQQGKAELKEQERTVAQAAAESRKAAKTAKIEIAQDNSGRAVLSTK